MDILTRRKSVQFFCWWVPSSAETVPVHYHGWVQTSEPAYMSVMEASNISHNNSSHVMTDNFADDSSSLF